MRLSLQVCGGLCLLSQAPVAHAQEAGSFTAGVHVTLPLAGHPTRGGFSVGYLARMIWLPPHVAFGTSTRFDFAANAPTRIDFLGHVGAAWTDEGPSGVGSGVHGLADLGVSWFHGQAAGLYVGGRAGGQVSGSPEVEVSAGVVLRSPAHGQLRMPVLALGLGAGRYLYGTAWYTQVIDGRLLRGPDGHWCAEAVVPEDTADDARAHVQSACEEWTSVATFLRTAAELASLGAPPALVAWCHRAARDELAHTLAQVALAQRAGLTRVAFEPLEVRPRAPSRALLAQLAVEAWQDGWVGEARAAEAMRSRRDAAPDPTAHTYDRIARDESSHAALGGAIVDWCLREDPSGVRHALAA